jgi:ATP-binding protein involved in chromosome partitioning
MITHPQAHSVAELRRIAATLPVLRRSLVGRSLPLAVV